MSRLKNAVVHLAHAFGFEIVKTPENRFAFDPRLTLGRDSLEDAKTILAAPPRCIFDVGAHVGQTARKFAEAFPSAEIYSFEPDSRSFAALRAATASLPRVHAVRTAMGAGTGEATLYQNAYDQTNSLLPNAATAAEFVLYPGYVRPTGTEHVPMTTVDHFCAEHGIGSIDLLKMDVQGYELEVLKGASATLKAAAVPLIYTEVSFVTSYESQPLFHDVYEYLYALDYRLVGIYESGYLTHYYQVGGNALFVHASRGRRSARAPFFRIGPVEFRR
jgi:FkbM family methyltransferase